NSGPEEVKTVAKPEVMLEPPPIDPILQPKAYAAPKVQEQFADSPVMPPATKPSPPAKRRWFNWFRNDPPAPKPAPTARTALPPADSFAVYDPDPVVRLIGCLNDDLLPSMREVSAETLARVAKDR